MSAVPRERGAAVLLIVASMSAVPMSAVPVSAVIRERGAGERGTGELGAYAGAVLQAVEVILSHGCLTQRPKQPVSEAGYGRAARRSASARAQHACWEGHCAHLRARAVQKRGRAARRSGWACPPARAAARGQCYDSKRCALRD